MRKDQQNALDSLNRSDAYLTQQAGVLGPIATSPDRKAIADAIAQIRLHITSQGAAFKVYAGQNGRVSALAKQLYKNHIAPIVRYAQANLQGTPEFATLSKSPTEASTKKLVDAAYAMAAAGKTYLPAMTTSGFPADTFDQLTAAANALNDAIVKREPMRVGAVQFTRTIEKLLKQGRDAVRRMDGAMRKKFANDEPSLDAWRAASRVMPNVAGRQPTTQEPATTQTTTPVTTTPPTTK